jgi:3-oxoadipate enol-lactonase
MGVTAIAMPRLGMTMEEGTVVEWPLAIGERVAKGETVLVIESEKSEVDVEATASGVFRHVYVEPGETVPCATLLGAITETVDEPFDPEGFAAEHRGPEPAASVKPLPSVPPGADAGRRVNRRLLGGRKAVAPAARALARRLGLDPEAVPGTGPNGRVTKQDVEAHAAARERLVTVEEGVALEVLREGKGDPVLLLPGFGTDVTCLALQARALAEHHSVVAVNPRGVGSSDAPELPCYDVARSAADAAGVLDAPAHVVGASLGAAVALELALSHSDRVRSLTLITPFVEATPRLLAVTQAWCRIAAQVDAETLARALAPWLFSEDLLADDTIRERTLRGLVASVAKVPVTTLERTAAGIAEWSGARSDDLDKIRVPCLVLAAGADLLTPHADSIAAAIPGANVIAFAGSGHALAIEAADGVSEAIHSHILRDPALRPEP